MTTAASATCTRDAEKHPVQLLNPRLVVILQPTPRDSSFGAAGGVPGCLGIGIQAVEELMHVFHGFEASGQNVPLEFPVLHILMGEAENADTA